MDDEDAVAALKDLGLTTYEAKVFVALQRLGTGTASDVADTTDVPRSQVYGATESLEEAGIVEVQQTRPARFRPVATDEARRRLLSRLERQGERAFDYLGSIRGTDDRDERDETVWTVEGADPIATRAASLIEGADDRVLYSTDAATVDDPVREAIVAALDRGLIAKGVSSDSEAVAALADLGLTTTHIPKAFNPDVEIGRVALADDDGFLLSVGAADDETAIWSVGTAVAAVIVQIVRGRVRNVPPPDEVDLDRD
ncbi:transcriptional regulator TrmB [Halobacteriales archaeon SW_7_68_16]|nr:MAG: transcriptional regulator TrmB [Halobacteriales archaeon SW_7_68_16]